MAFEPRADGLHGLPTQFGLLGRRTTAFFRCLYRTARMTYSATFISDPAPPASTQEGPFEEVAGSSPAGRFRDWPGRSPEVAVARLPAPPVVR